MQTNLFPDTEAELRRKYPAWIPTNLSHDIWQKEIEAARNAGFVLAEPDMQTAHWSDHKPHPEFFVMRGTTGELQLLTTASGRHVRDFGYPLYVKAKEAAK